MKEQHQAPVSLPPLAHAVGGAVGSTLSLLLLYPLERVRIEMQATTAHEISLPEKRNEVLDSTINDDFSIPVGSSFTPEDLVCSDNHNDEDIPRVIDSSNDERITSCNQQNIGNNEDTKRFNPNIVEENDNKNSICDSIRSHTSKYRSALKRYRMWSTIISLHNREELYKGSHPVAFTLAISNFIFFYALQMSKKMLLLIGRKEDTSSSTLFASTVAGVINVLLTNPLWVANLRIVQGVDGTSDDAEIAKKNRKKEKGLFETIMNINRLEGLRGLWGGTGASLLLVTNPVIQLYFYERIKSNMLRLNRRTDYTEHFRFSSLTSMQAFIIGAIAKAIATVATYPLQLAQVLLRLQQSNKGKRSNHQQKLSTGLSDSSSPEEDSYRGTFDCMVRLHNKGGLEALYSGMDAKLLQTMLTSAITFLTYEQILSFVAKSYVKIVSTNKRSGSMH